MFKKNVSKGPQVGPLAQLCQSKIGSIQFWQVLYSVHDPESLLSIHNFLEPPWSEHRVHAVTTSLANTCLTLHQPPCTTRKAREHDMSIYVRLQAN